MPSVSPPGPGAKLGEREFVALMAMIMALQALCIDAMLPALGIMAEDLGVSDPNQRQLVVGVYLIAAGVGRCFPVPWPIAMAAARCCSPAWQPMSR